MARQSEEAYGKLLDLWAEVPDSVVRRFANWPMAETDLSLNDARSRFKTADLLQEAMLERLQAQVEVPTSVARLWRSTEKAAAEGWIAVEGGVY
eukprot:6472984-Amphidinium_carterae.1